MLQHIGPHLAVFLISVLRLSLWLMILVVIFVPLERLFHLEVLCLEQERALVLVVRVQPLQLKPLVGAMARRYSPGPPVTRERVVEPAVGDLLGVRPWQTPGRLAAWRRTPAPATTGRTPATLRTHRTIVPVSGGRSGITGRNNGTKNCQSQMATWSPTSTGYPTTAAGTSW